MTATLAVAAADPQPVARLIADRRSLRGNSAAEDAFAALLDETAQDAEPADKDQPPADDPGRQDFTPPPSPHFLLAAHHAAVAHQAVNHEPRSVTTKAVAQDMAGPTELPVQPRNRSAAKPGRATEAHGKPALDGPRRDVPKHHSPEAAPLPPPPFTGDSPQPSRQPTTIEAMPDTEFKPIIIPATTAAKKSDENIGHADDDPAADPTETPAPQVSAKPDIAPSHQPTPQQQPIATQLAGRLAPAINQAQAILRILETAGESGPVIKTLQFGLRPRDLGEMRVTLSLGRSELSLRIETQTEEAARRLELDRSLLDTMLTQAGISIDRTQIDIRAVRFESQQPAASFEGAGPRGGGADGSAAHDHSQRQPRSGNPHQASEGHQHASSTSVGSDRRDRRNIYL